MPRKLAEGLITSSWLSTTGNGTDTPNCTPPTSGQKTWIAILLGMLFFIFASPLFSSCFSLVDLAICLLRAFLFTVVIRLIMW